RLLNATRLGPTRDAADLPNLSDEVDDISGVPDELERGRPVQRFRDDGEGAARGDLDERAGVRQCRRTRIAADREDALRESVETAAAKFHVNEEWGACGNLRGGGRVWPERHNLAVLRQVGDRAGLGHVDRIASHLQPGRDDV